MLIRNTTEGLLVDLSGGHHLIKSAWDSLFLQDDPLRWVRSQVCRDTEVAPDASPQAELPPIGGQEVWAAGVTYLRSRDARAEESEASGGRLFYERVYNADRPELFFKATPSRVVGNGQYVRIRADAAWNVPEPELTLAINSRGRAFGYTIGNDMSSRDIEAENPLYLPQAKIYDGSCALGPALWLSDEPPPPTTRIELRILRDGMCAFEGYTTLARMKRRLDELVSYLTRDNSFAHGCYLMTGTGIVPPDDFTLRRGDTIRISIDSIGTLTNEVGA